MSWFCWIFWHNPSAVQTYTGGRGLDEQWEADCLRCGKRLKLVGDVWNGKKVVK